MAERHDGSVAVERALSLLLQSARVSPPLRDAVLLVEQEIRRLTSDNKRMAAALLDVADYVEGNLSLEEATVRIEERLPHKTALRGE